MLTKADFQAKAVLRRNVKALMDKAKRDGQRELASQIGLGKKSGVGQATVGRILKEPGDNAGVETVAKIARAFGLEPWQIMVAGMDPGNPPVLQPVTRAERDLYDRLKQLAKDLK